MKTRTHKCVGDFNWLEWYGSSRWRLLGECQINCEIGEMLKSATWRNLKFQR